MSKKKKIRGLDQTIKRWKFLLEDHLIDKHWWLPDLPPCGFCKYYRNDEEFKCSPECPFIKYRGNTCGLDEDYENIHNANTKDEGVPYVMSILAWLFQLKHGVFDE